MLLLASLLTSEPRACITVGFEYAAVAAIQSVILIHEVGVTCELASTSPVSEDNNTAGSIPVMEATKIVPTSTGVLARVRG